MKGKHRKNVKRREEEWQRENEKCQTLELISILLLFSIESSFLYLAPKGTVMYSTVLYCAVQYSAVMPCTVQYCIVLYCTLL